jgi:hypothetical protein
MIPLPELACNEIYQFRYFHVRGQKDYQTEK